MRNKISSDDLNKYWIEEKIEVICVLQDIYNATNLREKRIFTDNAYKSIAFTKALCMIDFLGGFILSSEYSKKVINRRKYIDTLTKYGSFELSLVSKKLLLERANLSKTYTEDIKSCINNVFTSDFILLTEYQKIIKHNFPEVDSLGLTNDAYYSATLAAFVYNDYRCPAAHDDGPSQVELEGKPIFSFDDSINILKKIINDISSLTPGELSKKIDNLMHNKYLKSTS